MSADVAQAMAELLEASEALWSGLALPLGERPDPTAALARREAALAALRAARGPLPEAVCQSLTRIREQDLAATRRAQGELASIRDELCELARARAAAAELGRTETEARFVSRRV